MPDLLLAWLFLPLAVYILLSGADDLWMDFQWLKRTLRRDRIRDLWATPSVEGPIAVWVACWQESGVLERMLEHNLRAIADRDYCFFIGVYPNDTPTAAAAARVAESDPRVRIAEVPHDGPTSKADCLNWVYQRMLLSEEETGRRYRLVVIHDAEDLIHPRSFEAIRRAAAEGYDMVQVPVLALPTPPWELTHGLYCDDFAESQSKDLATRVAMGGFLPGCGVGTGFRREALDALAVQDSNRLFDQASLTEDYDNGLRLFRNGARQFFLDLAWDGQAPVATREYFPRKFGAAVRQRSRWITGNSLQAWERFGWGSGLPKPWVQAYFFWRDRKGMWGAPLGLFANVLLASCALFGVSSGRWRPWEAAGLLPPLGALLWLNGVLLLERAVVRMWVVSRIYGWQFALLSPLRTIWGNWVNTAACLRALHAWMRWRIHRIPLRWVKTEHSYPNPQALVEHRGKLGEILVSDGYCPPVARLDTITARVDLTRCVPETLQREHCLVVFEARDGELHVAAPRPPSDALAAELRRYTRLNVRFWLATSRDIGRVRATLQSRS